MSVQVRMYDEILTLLEGYADSYEQMDRQTPECVVPARAVNEDIRRNMMGWIRTQRDAAKKREEAEQANFGLSPIQIASLLSGTLKPEEINGRQDVQHERVVELLHWFARLVHDGANPKWTRAHACELAYYIATTGVNRRIDLKEFKSDSFLEGVNITKKERDMLERMGIAKTQRDE